MRSAGPKQTRISNKTMLPLHLAGRQLSLPRSHSHTPAAEGTRGDRGQLPAAAELSPAGDGSGAPLAANAQLLGAAGRGDRQEEPGPASPWLRIPMVPHLRPGEAELAAAGAAPSLHPLARRKVAGSPQRSAPAAALTHRGCWRRARRRRGSLSAGGGRGRLSRAMPSPHYTPWLVPAERPATSARRGCPCSLRPAGTGLHCRPGLRGPGRAHPPPGSRGTAGGGAGTPLPPCRGGRRRWERGELRQLPGGGGGGRGWGSRPAPSAGSGRWHLQPRRSAPGSLSSLLRGSSLVPRPCRTVPRIPGRRQRRWAFRFPRWSATRARRAGDSFLRLPIPSGKLAGRHPRPSAAVPGSAARPSQSVSASPPLPRSNQKPGGSGVMFAAPS